MTREEQETIFVYNQADEMAEVFTYDQSLIRKLDKLAEEHPTVTVTKTGDGCKTYNFPKKWLKVKPPRQLSDEKRQELAERARRNFGK